MAGNHTSIDTYIPSSATTNSVPMCARTQLRLCISGIAGVFRLPPAAPKVVNSDDFVLPELALGGISSPASRVHAHTESTVVTGEQRDIASGRPEESLVTSLHMQREPAASQTRLTRTQRLH